MLQSVACGQSPRTKIDTGVHAAETSASLRLSASYGKLPLSFAVNRGQADPRVRFLSRGDGYSLFLTEKEAVLVLRKPEKSQAGDSRGRDDKRHGQRFKTDVVRMQLEGAEPDVRVSGEDKLAGVVNYFIGNNPANWHSNVSTYGKVRYAGVYPGVDLVYYGSQRQLEYDFVIAPGAGADSIRLRFAGANKVRLDGNGDLEVVAANGDVAFHRPIAYQGADGARQAVEGSFKLLAKNVVGFTLGAYDHSKTLVIDPVLEYSTYLGGSTYDEGHGIAVDSAGSAYVTGETYSSDFPVQTPYQSENKAALVGASSAFVTKFSADGSSLVYSTFIGGSGNADGAGDVGTAITVDSSGDAYLTGFAFSSDFPTVNPYQAVNQAAPYSLSSPFVLKLNATGSTLIYSTFLGGTSNTFSSDEGDRGRGIAVDSLGDAYVTGSTYSDNFPVTGGAFQTTNPAVARNSSDAFISKLGPAGNTLLYSTYLGGSGIVSSSPDPEHYYFGDGAGSIAIDASGNAYVTGIASSIDFPVTAGAFQTTNHAESNRASNAFVSKLNSTGSALIYSTYLGGSSVADPSESCESCFNGDGGSGIYVDSDGNAYISGGTYSADFPTTTGAYQTTNHGAATQTSNAFVAKLNAAGSALVYSTLLGGTGSQGDVAYGLAVDSAGDAYLGGFTSSSDFPVSSNAFQPTNHGAAHGVNNAFIAEINPTGTGLLYSTYLGGSGSENPSTSTYTGDVGYAIAVDSSSNVYTTGSATSADFPTTAGAFQTVNKAAAKGAPEAFVAKFSFSSSTTQIATTTSLTTSAASQTAGVTVTFTAAVQPASGNGIPTGTITFSIDGVSQTPVTLDDTGHASYATSTLATGTHTIVASYSGDTNYSASTSNGLTETITAASSGTAATPAFSPSAGTYTSALMVTITDSTTGAVIHYTVDGTPPSSTSPQYGSPIPVNASETIQAIAIASGYSNSAVASAAYVINSALPAAGMINTIAGNGTLGYSGDDGPALEAEFQFPYGIAVDSSGDFYVADQENNVVRKVTAAGVITTFAGTGTAGYSGDGGQASAAQLNGPDRVALDSKGDLYIADTENNVVREVSPAGVITTVAGNGNEGFSGDQGPATSAELSKPADLVLDASGNLYIADWGNDRVRLVSNGVITTVAGTGVGVVSGDGGPATSAGIGSPSGLALDAAGNLYIADFYNHVIRAISTAGIISTFAGTGTQGYSGDNGPATSAEIADPYSVATDSIGDVYISDGFNQRIRMVSPQGIITTVAGNGTYGFSGDGGPAILAELEFPTGITLDQSGNLYIADSDNQRVRLVGSILPASTAASSISVASGSGQSVQYGSAFANPLVVVVKDSSGNPVSGAVVTFSGSGLSFSSNAVTTGSNGEASVTATATASGSLTATASISGVAGAANFSLTATMPALTVTATSITVPYGQPIPALTYTITGFVHGDTASVVTGTPVETTTATQGSAVATYPISISQGTLAAANYTLSFVPATVTITSLGTVQAPAFTPPAGTYTSAQQVMISDSTTGAVIYYTIGTAAPTASSTQYGSAITVGNTETLNAIAIAPGYADSAVATATYTINLPPPSFTLAASPTTATISAGKSAAFTLTVTPQNGFTQAVSFSCSGLPSADACSFSPQTVTPAGAAVSTTLTVTAATEARRANMRLWERSGGPLAVALLLLPFYRRRRAAFYAVVLLSLSALFTVGCVNVPKVQHSTVTVTASGGSVTQTTSLSLTVTQ